MRIRIIVTLLAGLVFSASALAAYKPDSDALTKDLERVDRANDRLTLVLWLPSEFWRASLEAHGEMTSQNIDRFVKDLDPYVVIAVADGQVGLMASVTFAELESLRSTVTIENSEGKVFHALPDSEISAGVMNLTQVMKPVLGNMMGSLGTHVAFLIFPGTDKEHHPTVQPTKEGVFIVHVGTVAMRYKLPLGSLLPPMIDPKSGETFPGNYLFSPFTGTKLSPAPEVPAPLPSAAGETAPPVQRTTEPSPR